MNPALKIIFEKSIILYKNKNPYHNPLLINLLVRPLQKVWLNKKNKMDYDRFSYDSYGWDNLDEAAHSNIHIDSNIYSLDENRVYIDNIDDIDDIDDDVFSISSYTWNDNNS